MESPIVCGLDPHEYIKVIPCLLVLVRSSSEDRKVLVETLRSFGELFGVTRDGVDSVPALKSVNVRLLMGVAGWC